MKFFLTFFRDWLVDVFCNPRGHGYYNFLLQHGIVLRVAILLDILWWIGGKFINFFLISQFLFYIIHIFSFLQNMDRALLYVAYKQQYFSMFKSLLTDLESLSGIRQGFGFTLVDLFDMGLLLDPQNFIFGRQIFDLTLIQTILLEDSIGTSSQYFFIFLLAPLVLFVLGIVVGFLIPTSLGFPAVKAEPFFLRFGALLAGFNLLLYLNNFLFISLLDQQGVKLMDVYCRLLYLQEVISTTLDSQIQIGETSLPITSFFQTARFGLLLFVVVNISFILFSPYLHKLFEVVGGGTGSPEDDDSIIPLEEEEEEAASKKKAEQQPLDQNAEEPAESKGDFLNSDQGMGTADVPPIGENRIPCEFSEDLINNPVVWVEPGRTYPVYKGTNLYTDGLFVSTSRYTLGRPPSEGVADLKDSLGIPCPRSLYRVPDYEESLDSEERAFLDNEFPLPDCTGMDWAQFSKTHTVNTLSRLVDVHCEYRVGSFHSIAAFRDSDTIGKALAKCLKTVPHPDHFVEILKVANSPYTEAYLTQLHGNILKIGALNDPELLPLVCQVLDRGV